MTSFVLSDTALEHALQPGADVRPPTDFTKQIAARISAQPGRSSSWPLSRAWPRLSPTVIQLLLVLLLLLVLALGAFVIGSRPPTDYTTRSGWILLEHFGANPVDGSVPAEGSLAPIGRSLWLIRADGTQLHEVTPGIPADGKTNPAWSRDGRRIAFESVYPQSLVYETTIDGVKPEIVGSHEPDCTMSGLVPCYERSPAYSPDGQHLVTVISGWGEAGQATIYLRQRYGSNEECSRPAGCWHLGYGFDSTLVSTSIEGLSWSPDGTQITFYRVAKNRFGKPLNSELWVVNADGTDPRVVPLPEELKPGDPDWSPDSSLIVFSSEPIHDWREAGVPGAPDVYTVRPDGRDLRQLTHDRDSGAPGWTSDGKILFYRTGRMWLMDADGSNAAPVYSHGPTLWSDATGWSNYGYWQPIP
jgi:Tol biopolymer transport system component